MCLVEGIKTDDLAPNLIRRTSNLGIDTVGCAPSLTEEKTYTVTLKNVPLILSQEPYVLGTQLHAICDCPWNHYGLRRADERRYVSGERMMCSHAIAFYHHLMNEFHDQILDVLPILTGVMNVWYTLKERTIIGDQKLTITRMNALLGMIIGYMTTKKAFD